MTTPRQRYETAGRAVYAWVRDVVATLPASLRGTQVERDLTPVVNLARDAYYAAREKWNAGQQDAAANQMSETLRQVRRANELLALARSRAAAGSELRATLDRWLGITSPLTQTIRVVNRAAEQLGGIARDLGEGVGAGIGLAVAAVLGIGLLVLAKK